VEVVEDGSNVVRTTLDKRAGTGLRSGNRRGDGRGQGAERERGESSNLHEGEHGEQEWELAVKSDERVLECGGPEGEEKPGSWYCSYTLPAGAHKRTAICSRLRNEQVVESDSCEMNWLQGKHRSRCEAVTRVIALNSTLQCGALNLVGVTAKHAPG
jgi:hypothetical protein